MKALHIVAFILVIIGALNWGIIGVGSFAGFDGNIVHLVLGAWPTLEEIAYVLVGLSAVWLLVTHRKECAVCSVQSTSTAPVR
jgi:hypothetical protein